MMRTLKGGNMVLKFPTSEVLETALLKGLESAQGEANTEFLDKFVINHLNLSDDLINAIRAGNRTELQYRMAWVRTRAKAKGLIERTGTKTWRLKK